MHIIHTYISNIKFDIPRSAYIYNNPDRVCILYRQAIQEELAERGVGYRDLFEKSELVQRLALTRLGRPLPEVRNDQPRQECLPFKNEH